MKKTYIKNILLLGIAILLTSCSATYYYSQLSSPNNLAIERKTNGDFVYENDSLWIAYVFKGENAPVNITIFNKMKEPLFINWEKSGLIIQNKFYAFSDTDPEFIMQTPTPVERENSLPFSGYSSQSDYTDLIINTPKNKSWIPQASFIQGTPVRINPNVLQYSSKKKYEKGSSQDKEGHKISIQKLRFDERDSPLKFSSCISYYYKEEETKRICSDFYIKNVMKTTTSPKNISLTSLDMGDYFYTKVEADNTGWQIFGVIAVTTGAMALEITSDRNNY